MSLSGEQIEALIPVLSSTIDDVLELDRIVYTSTGDRLFKQYASPNATLDEALFQSLTKLLARGTEAKVLGKIYRDRPGRDDVRAAIAAVCPAAAIEPPPLVAPLAAQHAGVIEEEPPVNAYAPGLERNVKPYLEKLDLHVWGQRLASIENQVCRIEIDGEAAGTGFLVGPQVVLTNWHVVKALAPQPKSGLNLAGLACRFNTVVLASGARSAGTVVAGNAETLVDWSLYTAGEATAQPDATQPTADELDYALLRLARPVGNELVAANQKRGFMILPDAGWTLPPDAPLLIVQHPDGGPMKLAMDTQAVIGLNGSRTRVRYRTNTEPGSSGSPCFSMDWELVALHHYGDPAWGNPKYNQGIPIGLIRRRLVKRGWGKLLADEA